MDKFYIIVITIFTVFLILILTFIGTTIVSGESTQQYPPVISQCPDYWSIQGNTCINNIDSTGNSIVNGITVSKQDKDLWKSPYYVKGDGNDGKFNIKPSDPIWASTGLTPACSQKKWANSMNIMWDGISNYNSC